MTEPSINAERLWSRLMDMAEIGKTPNGGSRRLALSQDDVDGRELFLSWCANRQFTAVHDRIGNLFLRRAGRSSTAAPFVIGSHLDTQPNGGRFDGVLGVLAGLEVLETLEDHAIATSMPVEVAVWTNEEGARFQPAMMGSGVHCGVHALEEMLAVSDADCVSVREEIERHGYDAGLEPGAHAVGCYVELHIEQGPLLEREGKTIGIVTGGQAIRWLDLTITGDETHAGPTPMAMRRDPVAALARVIDLVHEIGTSDLQARSTIGRIEVRPGSINVVPGQVWLTVDLRHPDDETLAAMQEALFQGFARLNDRQTKIHVGAVRTWASPAVRFDPCLVAAVRQSARQRGYPALDLVSGAGHDAFHLSRIVPTGMIFLPCRDGVSHNEREYAEPRHVTAGANVLLDVTLHYAAADHGRAT